MGQELAKATVSPRWTARNRAGRSRCSSTRPSTASSTPPASRRPPRPGCRPHHPVRQRQRAGADHGPAVRHLHRRRRRGRVGADRAVHGPAAHRRRPSRPAAGRFSWGLFLFQAVVEKITPAVHHVPVRRHPGARHALRHLQAVQDDPEQLEQPRRNSADKTKRRVFEAHRTASGCSPPASTATWPVLAR